MSAAGEEKGMSRYYTLDKNEIFRNEVHNKQKGPERICNVPSMSKPTIAYTHSGDLFVLGGREQTGKVSGDCYKLNGAKLVKI